MKTISELVGEMVRGKVLDIKTSNRMSWGNHTECRALFGAIFREVDKTFAIYQHLREYEEIVDWMTDTEDKGLLLMGDCGRGKSVIATGVVPVLLRLQNRVVRAIHAQDLTKPFAQDNPYAYVKQQQSNLDYLLKSRYPIIDEVGVENLVNNYGEKSEGVNLVINTAERYHRTVFMTTNLTAEQLMERYGERTVDRLHHLCRIVEFKGDSLRK